MALLHAHPVERILCNDDSCSLVKADRRRKIAKLLFSASVCGAPVFVSSVSLAWLQNSVTAITVCVVSWALTPILFEHLSTSEDVRR